MLPFLGVKDKVTQRITKRFAIDSISQGGQRKQATLIQDTNRPF